MSSFPKELDELIERLARFPGVGKRSAERIAFYILKMQQTDARDLARGILEAHRDIRPCSVCNNFSTQEICPVCSNPRRNKELVCVVEEPKDVLAFEKTSQYNGIYYVLLGSISPLEGLGPDTLSTGKLLNRVAKGQVKEVIIATDPDNEGELTAQYLIEQLSKFKVKIYRIGIGVPLGAQIEYIDSATLGRALAERRPVL